MFCLSSGIVKKLQQETKTRKKKHNRLLYLAKNKLDCVEILVSKSVMDGIIDHNEFLEIIKEKKDHDCQKNENCLKNKNYKFFLFIRKSINIFYLKGGNNLEYDFTEYRPLLEFFKAIYYLRIEKAERIQDEFNGVYGALKKYKPKKRTIH